MADGGDDRHRARGDRADEPLVAEREQILEAAAAAREHDHVDAGLRAELAQRVDDALRGARALDVRLGDEHVRRREAGLDRRDHVALRGGVVAGDEPDPARQQRQRALPLGGEEPLGGELRLQPLERGEVRADAEALDRERAHAVVAALLEELGPAEDVDALAVGEVEPQRRRTCRAASSRRRTSRRSGSLSVKKTLAQRVVAAAARSPRPRPRASAACSSHCATPRLKLATE